MSAQNRSVMKKRIKNSGVHLMLIVAFLILLFPVFVTLSTSLKHYADTFNWPPRWIPVHPTASNYVTVWFGEYHFKGPFFNSIFISTVTGLVTVVLAFPAAYALSRFRFRGNRVILFSALVTQMFSPIVLVVGLYRLIRTYHLLDTLAGIIITNCAFTLPMAVWLLTGYLANVPEELEEASAIDGCSRFRGLLRIVIPLALPGVAMAAIYAFIWSWNDLLIPLIYITSSELRPVSLALTDFVGRNIVYWNEMMAASIITTVPVAIMFSFIQKLFVKGFISGAIK